MKQDPLKFPPLPKEPKLRTITTMILDKLFTLPTKPAERRGLGNLSGGALSLGLAMVAQAHLGIVLVVVPDSTMAAKLERELQFFMSPTQPLPILSFPDWETLPYDTFSPHQDIISERLSTLFRLPSLERGILIVPMATLMHRVCPSSYVLQHSVLMKKGDTLELSQLRTRLESAGYRCVPQVVEHGEFAIRGSILDLYPMGSEEPYRIDLFDNEIDSIRIFEVESQRSLEKVDEIHLLPAREFPLTEEAITTFRTRFRTEFEGDPGKCMVYRDVSDGLASAGLEYYLPLFFEKTSSLIEYLPSNTLVVEINDVFEASQQFWEQVKERYEQYRHDRLRPILDPKALFLQPTEVFSDLKEFPKVLLSQSTPQDRVGYFSAHVQSLPTLALEPRTEKPLIHLDSFLKTFSGRVLFCAESAGRREVIKELLATIACRPREIDDWASFLQADDALAITLGPLEEGMLLDNTMNIAVITEFELLGRKVMQRRRRKARNVDFEAEVRNLAELTVGAPVVHLDYGVGRYLGLTHLTLNGQEAEFVTLEYAGGDKLYVPVASLHLISRYSGVDVEHAPLHRLGSEQWPRAKRKAMEQASDVAAELLEVYAKREAKVGFSFPKPEEQFELFCAEFPFEETLDQQRAIEQVLRDMVSSKPMDRIVCGDVGFGKTEVALRATFLAVQGGKQVAVLVPTTLLAEQHFQTFSDRFAGFPARVEVLSRFKSHKEQLAIIEALKAGKVDVLIGTHKILQSDIQFKNLGLLIIDEEHRFGVKQKETFKALRSEVDILTLTATPIPRTLNMAMSGIRDLSIIATPPAKRLSIKTFVRERQSPLIQEAVVRELSRGGQVYFLHNAVDSIDREARLIEELVPHARVAVAHGQMRERELEQIMSDFYHRRYNVLVCTTIIETGIDIPTANTIIIDRADKFGLAQLHQLRGRVGRSHHQAYAFCLVPPKTKLTSDAVKRLEALTSLEDLGAGFTLATQDLEIRGAGELLGESQSGDIQSVGFQLYMDLLDHAVTILKKGGDLNEELSFRKGAEVDLQIPALIPEAYIPDVQVRLVLYKRIASAKTKEGLQDLMSEMIDRFGKLPNPTLVLFKITELKLSADKLGITKIDAGPKGGRLEFNLKPNIDPLKIIRLIQDKSNIYSLEGPQKLKFQQDLSDRNTRIQFVFQLIQTLNT